MTDRQTAHIPVGLIIAWLLFLTPFVTTWNVQIGAWIGAVLLFRGFMQYEITEDRAINDQAYRDIQGMVIGIGIGIAVQLTYLFIWGRLDA